MPSFSISFLQVIHFLTGAGICFWGLKFFFAKSYFNYHQQATGINWEAIDDRLKLILLVFMRVIGIGSFTIGLIILGLTSVNFVHENLIVSSMISGVAILYLSGLFGISYFVYKKTNASTPWKRMVLWMVLNISSLITELIVN